MRANVDGKLPAGVTAKDIILAIIGEIGTAGGTGHVIEYAGEPFRALSMEGRMTVCNMSIEGGARAGMSRPTRNLRLPEGPPEGAEGRRWDAGDAPLGHAALRRGRAFRPRDPARRREAAPIVTWGTNPEHVTSITGRVPMPAEIADEDKRGPSSARSPTWA